MYICDFDAVAVLLDSGEQFFNIVGFALDFEFDASVGEISDPSGEIECCGSSCGASSESDALDIAFDDVVDAFHKRAGRDARSARLSASVGGVR